MAKVRVAINGFGRIGRLITRYIIEDNLEDEIELVAINDLGEIDALAHLLQFDSIHRTWTTKVEHTLKTLEIGGKSILVYNEKNPEELPWQSLDIDLVIESTGKFKTKQGAEKHLKAGAKKVIISAVSSDEDVKTIVLGANEDLLNGEEDIISNASCTTNSAAPLVKIIDDLCEIESGYITTVHSYTSDQSLHDKPHADFRRARAGALSIIPTSTGAAKAITKVFPNLDGRLGGAGIRVPVPNGSLTDITYIVKHTKPAEVINAAFKEASQSSVWSSYLEYTAKPLVSVDVLGNRHSCVFDSLLTSVIGNMVKVVGWYDNEAGYSSRMIDLIRIWSKKW